MALAQTLSTVSPATGDNTDGFVLTVNGSGFLLGTDVVLRRSGSPDLAAYGEEITGSQIKCRLDTAALPPGYYDVVVRAPNGTEERLPNGFLIPAARPVIYSNSFPATGHGVSLVSPWAIGAPAEDGFYGPTEAQEGTTILGTNLSGNYTGNLNASATIPAFSTTGRSGVQVHTQRWLSLASGDSAVLEYSVNGGTWTAVATVNTTTYDGGWRPVSYTLPAAADNQASVQIRFRLQTNNSNHASGWHIDDLKISANPASSLPPTFTSTPPATATVGQALEYSVTTSDADTAGTALTLTASGLPAGLTFTPNGLGGGTVSGTPTVSGSAKITLSASDGTYTTPQVFTLLLLPAGGNNPPVITTSSLPDAHVGVAYSATVSATDPDGHPIAFSVGTKPSWLSFTDNGNGTASLGGTPTAGSNGTVNLAFTATDRLQTDQETLSLVVHPRATIALSGSTASISEAAGSITITVNRTGNSYGPVNVAYATANGAAAAGTDYTSRSGTLAWSDGDTTPKTFTVPILDDAFTEGSETFTVTLSGLSGVADLGTASATITILDNDNNTAPAVTLIRPSANVQLTDRADALVLTASLTDDGKPAWGSPSATWTQVSGPAGQTVTFANPGVASTTVTFPADGAYLLRLTVSDGEFSTAREVRVHVGSATTPASGTGVTRELFSGISGSAVSALTGAAKFTGNQPDSSTTLTGLFEAPSNVADNYGQRVRGYFFAPQTGNYTFVIASDDASELWLSTTPSPAGKVKIAQVSGYTNSREWTKEAGQTSAAIPLVAGQYYYIEALHKEGSGGDHLAVGVTLPDATVERPIPAARLGVYLDIPDNAAPDVRASVSAAPNAATATVVGTVSDDGKPASPGVVSISWAKVSGPGSVIFDNPSASTTAVTVSASGNYVLALTADDGSAATRVTLDLTFAIEPPVATTMSVAPGAASVLNGTSQTFTATVFDQYGQPLSPQPIVTWTVLNGLGSVTSGGVYSAPPSGTGTATVQAQHGALTAAATVTYAPIDPPVFTSHPANASASAGQTVAFTVATAGASISYQWQQNTNGVSWVPIPNATGTTYTTPPLTSADNGVSYRCVATNSGGAATSNPATVAVSSLLDGSLWSWWKLDEASGATAADASRNNRALTIAGAGHLWAPSGGRLAGALDLPGGTSGTPSPQFTPARLPIFSFTAWAYADTYTAGSLPRFFQITSFAQLYYYAASSTLNFQTFDSNGVNIGHWSFGSLPTGVWYHIAVVYDSTATQNVPQVYIDGVARTATMITQPTQPIGTPSGVGYIGNGLSGTAQRCWDGRLDDVRFYTRTLAASEIQALAAQHTLSPIASWRLGSFAVTDSAGSAADSADPDEDGLSNILEYALGADPLAADATALSPTLALAANRLQLSFPRLRADLTYTVQTATDLSGTWTDVATNPGQTGQSITVPDAADLSAAAPRRFLRLKVSAP